MSTMHNSEASPEVHELKHELSEEELKNVFGGESGRRQAGVHESYNERLSRLASLVRALKSWSWYHEQNQRHTEPRSRHARG
jgi:hypothetical protein